MSTEACGHHKRAAEMLHRVLQSISKMDRVSHDAFRILWTGVEAVQPHNLIPAALDVVHEDGGGEGVALLCRSTRRRYPLNHNLYVVAAGKAAGGMMSAVQRLLDQKLVGEHLVKGVVALPADDANAAVKSRCSSGIEWFEGTRDNIVDSVSVAAGRAAADLVDGLGARDVLLVLLTGGGSALMAHPPAGVAVDDVATTTRKLAHAGFDISQLNLVRQRLDLLKGGGLARLATPAQVLSLVLSDIVGDPLELVASGPTVRPVRGRREVLKLVKDRGLLEQLAPNVQAVLTADEDDDDDDEEGDVEEEDEEDKNLCRVSNVMVGNNSTALTTARHMAASCGYTVHLLTSQLQGDAASAGRQLSAWCRFVCALRNSDLLPTEEAELLHFGVQQADVDSVRKQVAGAQHVCLLMGGETTVQVPAECGRGGRVLHVALAGALHLHRWYRSPGPQVRLLALASDGADAETGAAGAMIDPQLVCRAKHLHLDADSYLRRCDSLSFFEKVDDGAALLKTGLTGTNVMDLMCALIDFD